MLYRCILLQILALYIKLYVSKIYLKSVDAIDISSDETQSIFILLPARRTKSLSIEDLEPSKSLVRPIKTEDDIAMENLHLSKQQKDMLRKRWQSSCDRRASKACVKACRSTVKIVCSSFKCKRSMKRNFKKECKRNCKATFLSSKDDEDSD